MKTTYHRCLILVIIAWSFSIGASAWGLEGHRIVGQIAETYLTRKAKKEISRILGTESVAMTSNWADFAKSDSNYDYLYPWHYVNLKAGMTEDQVYDYLRIDTNINAYTKINFLTAALKNQGLNPENKLLYLRLLIHIVGDIHQPMHTARPEDLGGNKVKVQWFGVSKNLHQVWDDQLILHQQLSYTEYTAAINFSTPEQRRQWQQEPLNKWVYESYLLAEKIYSDIQQPDQRLEYNYNFKYVRTVNEQLLKGGVRLAGILNALFG